MLWSIIEIIDILLFVLVSATALYLTVFTVASLFYKRRRISTAKRQLRFVVIVPSYKQDGVIEGTVKSVLGQTYPQRLFDVTVVSDHQTELTNFRLAQYPITLLTPDFDVSTKIRSYQLAIEKLPQFKIYDVVVVLAAGALVEPEFLSQLNDAYCYAGTKAIEAHCVARYRDTAIANLGAIFDEINNSIFRRGHIAMGISAAVSGSGMAFDFEWFKTNIPALPIASDDKTIEAQLMRQQVFIDYFDDILVYTPKSRDSHGFGRQHSVWIVSQVRALVSNLRYLPGALMQKKHDMTDKIIQWMLLPRTVMMAVLLAMCVAMPFIYFTLAVKWWVLMAAVLFVFAVATPDYLVDEKWNRSFLRAPLIMAMSILGLSGLLRAKGNFINKNDKRRRTLTALRLPKLRLPKH